VPLLTALAVVAIAAGIWLLATGSSDGGREFVGSVLLVGGCFVESVAAAIGLLGRRRR
jgi:hypothetical protein